MKYYRDFHGVFNIIFYLVDMGKLILERSLNSKDSPNQRTLVLRSEKIALYNAENKEVIGVFASTSLAAEYLYNGVKFKGLGGRESHVNASIRGKGRILDSRFPFPVAARFAKPELANKLIDGKSFIVFSNYPTILTWLQEDN